MKIKIRLKDLHARIITTKQNAHILPYCLAASTAHIAPPSTKTKNELKSINFSIKCFRPLNYCHCHNYESS